MASIKFDFTGDNSSVLSAMQGVQSGVRQTAKEVESQGESIERMFDRVKKAAAASLAGFSIKEFVTKCASIRGEFQQLEMAFTTMLGNAQQASEMMGQLTKLAATTPFDMKGVTSGAKQLLAYGVAADDVVDTMRRLGDIAAGLSLPLTDLAWLYGTTLTQGRMFTMDLRQFQARGIPMADELAKIFGVTRNEVAGLVTAGKVGSAEVTQAIQNMTAEGSRFGGLMDAQSHTITGQWSNIQDTIEMAFNDLGKQNEGVINDALALTSLLIDHWKEIGTAILSVAAAYGTYKAALMATTAIQSAQRNYRANTETAMLDEEIAKYRELVPAKEESINADLREAVAKGQLTEAQAELIAQKRAELELTQQQAAISQLEGGVDEQIASLQALKAASESNIDADLREAVASGQITKAQAQEIQSKRELLGTLQQEAQARVETLQAKAAEAQASYDAAVKEQASASMELDNAHAKIDAAREALQSALESGDAEAQSAAQTQLKTAVDNENAAAERLKAANARVSATATEMNTAAEAANTAQERLNTTTKGANTVSTGANTTATVTNTIATRAASAAQAVFAAAINGVKNAWNAMKVAMMTNPIGAILGVVSIAVGAFMTFAGSEEDAADAGNEFDKSQQQATAHIKTLLATLKTSSEGTKEHKDALASLNEEYDKYGIKLDETVMKKGTEAEKTKELIQHEKELVGAIEEEAIAKAKANQITANEEDYQEEADKVKDKIQNAMGSAFSDEEKKMATTLITDEEIEAIAQKSAKLKAMAADLAKGLIRKDEYDSAAKEYQNMIDTLSKKLGNYARNLGKDTDAQEKATNAVRDNIQSLINNRVTNDEKNESVLRGADAANRAAQLNDGMTESERQLADQAKLSKEDVETLGSTIDNIIKTYNNSNINLTISYEELNTPPSWMTGVAENLSSKELNNLAAYHQSRANKAANHKARTGHDLVQKNSSGGYSTERDELVLAGQYSALARKKKQEEDKAAAQKPKTPKKPKKDNSANEAAQRAERLRTEQERWDEELAKQHQEAMFSQREADIAQIKDNAEKERAERALQHDKDLYQLQQQTLSFKKANYQHNKAIFESSAKGNKNKYTGTIAGTALTADQQKQIDAQRSKIEAEYIKDVLESLREETANMDAYMKEYGSLSQRIEAINRDYERQKAEETDPWKQQTLEKQRQADVTKAQIDDISSSMDWGEVFGGFGTLSKSLIDPLIERIQQIVQSDAFKEQDYESQSKVYEMLDKLRDMNNVFDKDMFAKLNKGIYDYQNSLQKLSRAQAEEIKLHKDTAKALADYQQAEKALADAESKRAADIANGVSEDKIKSDEDSVRLARENVEKMKGIYNDRANAEIKATNNTKALANNIRRYSDVIKTQASVIANNIRSVAEGMASIGQGGASLESIGNTFMNIDEQFNGGKITSAVGSWIGGLFGKDTQVSLDQELQNKMTEYLEGAGGLDADTISSNLSQMVEESTTLSDADKEKIISKVGKISEDAASGNAEAAGQGIVKALTSTGAVSGIWGAIISAILSLLDAFKEYGIGGVVEQLLHSITDALVGIIENTFSSGLGLDKNFIVTQITRSVAQLIGKILEALASGVTKTLGFGSIGDIFGIKGNGKEVAETTERLTKSNEALTTSVDNLKNSIDKSGGKSAVEDYQQAYKDQLQINEQTKEILETQMGYTGAHHSNRHYWNRDNDKYTDEYKQINELLARKKDTYTNATTFSVGSYEDFMNLTPEQMRDIKTYLPEIWKLFSQDIGKYDKSEYFENYVELAGKLEELTEKINENLTQTTFDSLKSNFVSDIMDMSKTASDFANDFTEMIAKAWTNAAVNDLMNEDLKNFYEKWADKMKAGTLTKEDIDALREEYESLTNQALNIRDTMSSVTGYTGDTDEQNASANGVSSITYDQSNQFIGLVTAGNIVRQNISDSLVNAVASLSVLTASASTRNSTLVEIRNLMVFNNSYLEDILKVNRSFYNDFNTKIEQTNKYLKEIK